MIVIHEIKHDLKDESASTYIKDEVNVSDNNFSFVVVYLILVVNALANHFIS